MKLVLAQFNAVVGDLAGNAGRIAQLARAAHAEGAHVVLMPELALCGAPAGDLLLRPAFLRACDQTLDALARELADCEGLHVLVGHPRLPGLPGASDDLRATAPQAQQGARKPFNAVSLLCGGRLIATACKRGRSADGALDGCRHFARGGEAESAPIVFTVDGWRLAVLIGEDLLAGEQVRRAREAGAQALCVLAASPFLLGGAPQRERRMAALARSERMPLLHVNLVGGQDELVFDGASFALDAQGQVVARAASFEEESLYVELGAEGAGPARIEPQPSFEAQAWGALVRGLRDYIEKNGFPGAVIGLSGGMDSALVLALAVDAIGADRVRTVMMPSPYTAQISLVDARDMAARLGVRHEEIAIAPLFDAFTAALAPSLTGLAPDTTEENVQARVRGTLLMALSNKTGWIVLTTGNKSELATGYCTLYGDMAGGFAVIKDVYKTLVYRLARWRNAQPTRRADGSVGAVIPERIITRAPSAELRPDQTDQDSLPPYEVLDAILERHVEGNESCEAIVAAGHERAVVEKVLRLVRINEYKRRQAPIGTRITRQAFGSDWRQPITCRFRA
ncbi:MAG: NAD+ synthase [Burkholderiales bacterium]|nr:NAD+ synthase [Burkholderiales bacterium]